MDEQKIEIKALKQMLELNPNISGEKLVALAKFYIQTTQNLNSFIKSADEVVYIEPIGGNND